MDIKKMQIGDKYYDVYDAHNVPNDPGTNVAIMDHESGTVLPVRKDRDRGPGYYPGYHFPSGNLSIRILPTEEEREEYSADKVIDFNCSTLGEYIQNMDRQRRYTESTLSNVDNVYQPTIRETDEPLMQLMKTAVHQKHFDISKYRGVFGSNFNNDKRSLESNSITISKAAEIASKLDMEIFVGFKNAPGAINPMRDEVYGIINASDFEIHIGPIQHEDEEFNPVDEDEDDYYESMEDEEDDY